MPSHRNAVRDLADRLVVEYAGAVPPGQVLALVFRTDRHLAAVAALAPQSRLVLCEQAVRRALAQRLSTVAPAARRERLDVPA